MKKNVFIPRPPQPKEIKLEVPLIPSFIRIKGTTMALPIQDIAEDTLRGIADQWTEKLIENSKKVK